MVNFEGKIGVELECYVPNKNENKLTTYCSNRDINLYDEGGLGSGVPENGSPYTGEETKFVNHFSTELNGMGLVFDLKDIKGFYLRIKEIFNHKIKVNSRCGLHIHLSFKNDVNYYKLVSYNFVSQFQHKVSLLFNTPYEKMRLSNNYCKFYSDSKQFNTIVGNQVKYRSKCSERYQCVNYNSFNLYKTIEFRIFPATQNLKTFKKYVTFLLKTVDTYLSQSDFKPIKREHKFKIINKDDSEKITSKIVVSKDKLSPEQITGLKDGLKPLDTQQRLFPSAIFGGNE